MRNVTSVAGVNLAAVHYHFGSKDALLDEVFARRIGPLNRERLRLLDRLEERDEAPTLEELIAAFIGPSLEIGLDPSSGGQIFMQLLGHAMSEPQVRARVTDRFVEVFRRYSAALSRAESELSTTEIDWRFMFMVGAMAHTMSWSDQMQRISGGLCDPTDVQATIRRLVAFLAAGFRAPAPAEVKP